MLMYPLDKNAPEPLYSQIYRHIRQDIEDGTLKSGEKLPSRRDFAAHSGVSISTVENAYGQLLAEGYLRSEPKKGYFVEALSDLPEKPPEVAAPASALAEESVPYSAAECFPFSVWLRLMREELASNHASLSVRCPAEGVLALREAIAESLKQFRAIQVSPEQILIGAGTEYLYILLRVMLGEPAVIAVEDPGYGKMENIYRSLGLSCVSVPMQEDGIDLEALRASEADAAHISPSHQFPTGVITSVAKRYELLGWASQGHLIIEDDYDSEFRLSGRPVPSLFSIDVTDRVIYMNTFSKSLSPGIRIAYMVLPWKLLGAFRERLRDFSCPVPVFEQYTLARFIREGYFEKHIRRLRRHCKEGRERLLRSIAAGGVFAGATPFGDEAGMHCVVQFPAGHTDEELLQLVRAQGFRARLLSECYRTPPAENLHRLLLFY